MNSILPDEIRSLLTEACSLEFCPEAVRAWCVEVMSTEKLPRITSHSANPTTMIPDDLRALITEACAQPHCPEIVRERLAEYLATGRRIYLSSDEAADLGKPLWSSFTVLVFNADFQHSMAYLGFKYQDRLSRARSRLRHIRTFHDPRE